jgi:hypothetical protein
MSTGTTAAVDAGQHHHQRQFCLQSAVARLKPARLEPIRAMGGNFHPLMLELSS